MGRVWARGFGQVFRRPFRLGVMVAAALFGAGVASVVLAATPPDPPSQPSDDFAPQPNRVGPAPPHRDLQWDAKTGRWGLDLEMAQPTDRDLQWGDTRVGVHYRLAPGLRTGLGVTLGNQELPDGRLLNSIEPTPRVRLETTFKF
jgi:NtrZ